MPGLIPYKLQRHQQVPHSLQMFLTKALRGSAANLQQVQAAVGRWQPGPCLQQRVWVPLAHVSQYLQCTGGLACSQLAPASILLNQRQTVSMAHVLGHHTPEVSMLLAA